MAVRSGSRFVQVDPRVARHGEQRRRTRGTGDGQVGRQTEMTQYPADHGGLLDQRDEAQASATARTTQDVERKRPPQQIRPALTAHPALGGVRRGGEAVVVRGIG